MPGLYDRIGGKEEQKRTYLPVVQKVSGCDLMTFRLDDLTVPKGLLARRSERKAEASSYLYAEALSRVPA
jgi:hypothetical protein